MIKISSFSPMQNFTRWSWEFHDDKMVVKTKSLTIDYEREVKYAKIKSIRNKRTADLGWLWASFIIIGLLGLVKMGLNHFCITSPIIDVIEKIVMIFALVLIIPAFRKNEYYSFLDTERNDLVTVKIYTKSKQSLLEAINLIKQKTEITGESYFNDILPSTPPVFQFTEFDFPDFLNKSDVRVYEDRIIDVEKSLVEELTTVIKYNELSGETKFARMGNDNWSNVWSYWFIFVCMTEISAAVFFADQMKGNYFYLYLLYSCLALTIPLFFLKFIKSEILFFYDKLDNVVFWTRINSANREKLNQIVEFVKGKVEPQK